MEEPKRILDEAQANEIVELLAGMKRRLSEITGTEFEVVAVLHPVHENDVDCMGVSICTTEGIMTSLKIMQMGLMTVAQHASLARQAVSTQGMTKQ